MYRAACFFISLFLFFSLLLPAQQLLLESYTPKNGLVDSRVIKIFQDSRGLMYFLTQDGFSIFDGQHFDNFSTVDGKPIGMINDIIENPDKSLSLFCFSGVILTIDKNRIRTDSSQVKDLSEINKVTQVAEDDYIFFTNYSMLRKKAGKLQRLNLNYNDNKELFVENAYIQGDYIVFFSWSSQLGRRLFLYNYKTQQVADVIGLFDILNLQQGRDNTIYFLDNSTTWRQLNKQALQKGKLVPEKASFESITPPGFEFSRIDFDPTGNLWCIKSGKGCYKVNMQTGEKEFFSVAAGLNNTVVRVFQDREKNYWFQSSTMGVQKLQQSQLNRIETLNDREVEFLYTINNTADGDCFVSTVNGNHLINRKQFLPGNSNVASICFWQNQLWHLKDYKTLYGSKGISLDLSSQVKNYSEGLLMLGNYARIDREGRLVISGTLLIVIDKSYKMAVTHLPYFADDVVVDEENNYWCFMRSNEVAKYRWQNGNLELLQRLPTPGLNPRAAILWDKDRFFIGTRNDGLVLAQVKKDTVIFSNYINKKNGLSNNFIYSLIKKTDKGIIAGTASGLDHIRFSFTDTSIETISAKNNIFSSFAALVMDSAGNIFCKTHEQRLYKLNNAEAQRPDFIPRLYLRSVTMNGKSLEWEKKLRFYYTENNISFSVSAPSFLDNTNIEYHFRLKNKNKLWSQDSKSADFAITNLEPGSYTLTCTAAFPGKIYEDQSVTYSFTILPPFWKTWWFIALVSALVLLVIILAVRSYFRKQLEKQKVAMEKELAIEQERTRMARELHDGLGSMLSGIKHSFAAMKNQMTLNAEEEIKFHSNIDKLNESIKELRSISHSLYSDSLLKYGLDILLNEYCNNLSQNSPVQISFSTLNMEETKLTEEQSFHIYRIVQELIQNIVNHAAAAKAIVQLSYNNKHLYITVEDNGKGFDMTAIKKVSGIGLKNIESRVKILKGKMDYRTAPGQGTSVFIEIPIAENA